ncbi:ABC transporter substrate-binding protein [Aliidongia dinghuensis]|uniref:ABC transporter substrate-binding protein n=1 Tax=Aliidongia dinghuensis TaxID=1867774 RepID=A0A8J3E7F3_9PROT|nr:ABC transporter substrate-binding protein [Aliidongia dinghuensis]GGF39591.1 ABC transporter substrate-binding protein [Aliidongia dinghuensis]
MVAISTGRPTRRTVLKGSLGLAGTLMLAGGRAFAAPDLKGKTVVFASWGGAYQDAEKASYCDPFAQATGARVVQDGPMNTAKFRAMIESGAPDWDVADITIDFLYSGIGDQLFEKIDKSLVDTSRLDPRFVNDYGIGCIVWSYNLGYSTKAFTGANVPRTWADVFDLKRFPGKRTFGDNVVATLEAALLADGVAPANLYPLDVERALKKLDTIKAETVFWSSESQSQQLFVDGEVTLGLILNGRAYDAAKKGAPIAVSWEQNIQSIDYLVVPHGSKNREAAMRLIDGMTQPENQAKLANMIAYAPTNPAAFAKIDPAIAPWLPTAPDNVKRGFLINAEYWRDNLKKLQERWTAWKLA